ncbi:MAG: hypothetical protein EBT64_06805 [Gammaproteobacteria bacterium]|jgi:hypothetical protein|nr:hypothetical protein [Gammaproteobacteria bacterium]
MYSELFLFQALLQAVLVVWLWRVWKSTGLLVAGLLLIPQFGLVYDNLIVGAGRFIGFSPLLEAISWPRFWIHWLFGTWLIVVAGVALRLAGFQFMRGTRPMLIFCSLTFALMMYDLPHFWNERLYPVCEFDLIRYSTAVSADTLCFEGQQVVRSSPPIPSIITCFVVIGSGALLMFKRKFPWMFLGGVLMLASAMPPLRNFKLDNFGEILIAGGCIWALSHFSRDRKPGPYARASDSAA